MTSCPNCGFDLSPEGSCPVCGYGKGESRLEEATGTGRLSKGAAGSLPADDQGRDRSEVASRSGATALLSTESASKGGGRRISWVTIVVGMIALCVLAAVGVFVLLAGRGTDAGVVAGVVSEATALLPAVPAASPAPPGAEMGPSPALTAPTYSGPLREPYGTEALANVPDATLAEAGTASEEANQGGSSEEAQSQPDAPLPGAIDDPGVGPYTDPAVAAALAQKSAQSDAVPAASSKAIDLWPAEEGNESPAFDLSNRTELPPLTSEEAYVQWMAGHHPEQQEKFLRERWQRARYAVQHGHITHERILQGFLLAPREWFIRAANIERSYDNAAIPIGYGQTISGPDLVARMTDFLNPQPDQRVLEIGTGSGYQSAFLSELSNNVFTIEIVQPLAEETNKIYLDHTKELPEYVNVHRRVADGYYGWPEHAPFDRIIVTCGIDHIPPELLRELAPGGIMVIPIGPPSGQTILKITKQVDKDGNVSLTREDIYHGRAKDIFVPFTAAGGGRHSLASDLRNGSN